SIAKPSAAADSAGRLIGSGPYRVVDASPGRLALEAMPGYWAGAPKSERLVFLDVSADDQAESDLDARSLDIWFPAAPPRRAEGALSAPGLRVGYLAFQTEKEPFSQRTLRRAVAAAIDPAILGQTLDRAAVPLQSFLPPGVWGRREGSPILGGSRTTVKALVKDSRWPKETKPTFLVPAETSSLNLPRLAETIQLLLGADDLPLNVQVEPEATMRSLLQAGAFDVALTEGTVAGGDPHLLLYPLSTSEAATKGPRAANFSFFRNQRLDDVLVRGHQLSFRSERQRLYQRGQAMLAEELPWLPIYVRLQWAVARSDVKGLRLHPSGIHRLDTVSLEIPPALAPAPGATRCACKTLHMSSIADTPLEMIEWVFPDNAGGPGQIHGGRMMEWITKAGTLAASRVARGTVVLGAMDDIDFLHPVKVGQIAILRASVEYVGTSS